MRRIVLCIILSLVIVVSTIIMIISKDKHNNNQNYYEITQYGNDDGSQAMFYTITTPNNELIVIDGGPPAYSDYLRSIISEKGNKVDSWILTHPHIDHIGAFMEVYKDLRDIEIDKVYTTQVDYDYFLEISGELDIYHLDSFELYKDFIGLNIQNLNYLNEGDVIDLYGMNMKVFNAYTNKDVIRTLTGNIMNETSLVFKLTNDKESILFCADIDCIEVYDRIVDEYGTELSAKYIQVAHHGTGYYEALFDVINPSLAFVDAPKWLREKEDYPVYDNLKIFEDIGLEVYTYNSIPNTIRLY